MPKIVDHDERRVEILEKSFALYADRGYAAVSMRQLAGELGFSTGTLYHYFPNKASHFEAMLRFLSESKVAEAVASIDPDMSFKDRLAVIHAYVVANADHIRQILWVAIDYQRTVGTKANSLIRDVLDVHHRAVAEQLCDGNWERSRVLISYIIGVIVHRGLVPDEVGFDNLFDNLHTLILAEEQRLRA